MLITAIWAATAFYNNPWDFSKFKTCTVYHQKVCLSGLDVQEKIFLHALSNSRDIHCAFMLKNKTLSTTMFWICHIHNQGAANFLYNVHIYSSKDKFTVAGSENIILKTQ